MKTKEQQATEQKLQFVIDSIKDFFYKVEVLNFPTNVIADAFGESKAFDNLATALQVLEFTLTEFKYFEEKDEIEHIINSIDKK